MKVKKRKQYDSARSSKAQLEGQQGFTLIETSIALILSMVVGLGSASLFVYSIKNNSGGSERALALAVGQQELERLRNAAFGDISVTTTNTTVTSAGRNYSVNRVVCNTSGCGGSTSFKVITITVTPQAAGPNWARSSVILRTHRTSLTLGTN